MINIFIIKLVEIGPKLWEKYRFELLAPIRSHVNENEKQW